MWRINKPPAEEPGAHLGWFVPERCHPSFLRPSEHKSAAIVVWVTVHHWGSRHWIPEIWSAAQLRPSGEDIKIINNQKDSEVPGWTCQLLNVIWLTRVVRSCFCSGPARSLPSWSQSGSAVAPIGEDIHRRNSYLVETQSHNWVSKMIKQIIRSQYLGGESVKWSLTFSWWDSSISFLVWSSSLIRAFWKEAGRRWNAGK